MTKLQDRTREKIQAELDRRIEARNRLIPFITYTFPQYLPEAAHYLMAEALEDVVFKRLTKLMIFAPPQHGKSEQVSRRFIPFWFGHRPNDPAIMASYEATLAVDNSKQARGILNSQEYDILFPDIEIDQTSRAGDLWRLGSHCGSVRAAGIGGGLTGHPALVGLIDDPVKNRKDAASIALRKTAQEWWTSSYRTRVWAEGAHVLIMTRWHYDDLAGWLLRTQGGYDYQTGAGDGEWAVLRLPAIAEYQTERDENNKYLGLPEGLADPLGREPGEALCPIRYDVKALASIRKDIGPRDWASLYQGVPRVEEGKLFRVEKINIIPVAPAQLRTVRYWDLAATAEDALARTAGGAMGERAGEYTILDMKVGEWSPGGVENKVKQTARTDGKARTIWIEQEPGSAGVFVKHVFKKLLAGWSVWFDKVTGKKEIRWLPFAAQVEAGNVNMVKGPWNNDVLEELDMQPDAPRKDITDCLSGAFSKLADRKEFSTGTIDFYAPQEKEQVEFVPAHSDSEIEELLKTYEER